MNYMVCNSCRATVQTNNTGICLGCQRGFNEAEDSDHFEKIELNKLLSREREIEDAIREKELIDSGLAFKLPKGSKIQKQMEEAYDAFQKQGSKSISVREQAKTSKRVRKQNPKRKETSTETKEWNKKV